MPRGGGMLRTGADGRELPPLTGTARTAKLPNEHGGDETGTTLVRFSEEHTTTTKAGIRRTQDRAFGAVNQVPLLLRENESFANGERVRFMPLRAPRSPFL